MSRLGLHLDNDNAYHIGPDEMKVSDEVVQKMLEEIKEGEERKLD